MREPIVLLMFLVLLLCGCPKPKTEKTATPGKTVAGKTAAKTGAIKTGEAKTGGAEGLNPLPSSKTKKIGIQAGTVDPVCGMEVSITNPGATYEFGDTAYLFCSEQCRDTFKANPKQYLRKE